MAEGVREPKPSPIWELSVPRNRMTIPSESVDGVAAPIVGEIENHVRLLPGRFVKMTGRKRVETIGVRVAEDVKSAATEAAADASPPTAEIILWMARSRRDTV